MEKNYIYSFVFIFLISVGLMSCASSFDKIKDSGDSDLILSAADQYYKDGEWLNAQVLYENVIGAFRGREDAERIYYNYSNSYFELNQYLLAAYYFKRFAITYPNSKFRDEADFMTAYAEYKRSPKYRLDQSSSENAIEAFQNFVNKYPTSDRIAQGEAIIAELNVKKEKKSYSSAQLYYDMRNYQSAAHCFKNFAKDYPSSKRIEEARYLAVKSEYLLADNSIPSKQFERYETLVKDFEEFVEKYPSSSYTPELEGFYNISKNKINTVTDE